MPEVTSQGFCQKESRKSQSREYVYALFVARSLPLGLQWMHSYMGIM